MTDTITTNQPIILPSSPDPGESVVVDLVPEDLTIRLSWEGNGVDDSTDYWRVIGDFSWGNKYDDLYVSKTGDKMSGFLVNLSEKYENYDPDGTSPLDKQNELDSSKGIVSFINALTLSGLTLLGSYGIEDNKELPATYGDVIIRNDAIIGGSATLGGLIKVIKAPYIEGGDAGEPITYSYRWQRCNDRRYRQIDDNGRDTTFASKAEIYKYGTPDNGLGDYDTTPRSLSSTGSGCQITIDQVNEDGLIMSFTIKDMGSGYKSGEILKVDDSDIEIVVTDTIVLNPGENEPPTGDVCWSISPDIDSENDNSHLITNEDIGSYIRCEITCTVGSKPEISYSNPLVMISQTSKNPKWQFHSPITAILLKANITRRAMV